MLAKRVLITAVTTALVAATPAAAQSGTRFVFPHTKPSSSGLVWLSMDVYGLKRSERYRACSPNVLPRCTTDVLRSSARVSSIPNVVRDLVQMKTATVTVTWTVNGRVVKRQTIRR